MGLFSSITRAISSVGNILEDTAKSAVNLATTPYDTVRYIAQGDLKGATNQIKQGVGSALDSALPRGSAALWRSDEGQTLLRNPTVDSLSLGYTGDLAGYAHGAGTLQQSNSHISKDDLYSIGRFGVKTAVGAVGAYNLGLPSQQQALTGSLVGNRAASGDVRGAIGTLVGSDNPFFDSPDWLGQIGDNLARSPTGSTSPYVNGYPLSSDSGFGSSSGNVIGLSMLGLASVVALVYLARKKGVI